MAIFGAAHDVWEEGNTGQAFGYWINEFKRALIEKLNQDLHAQYIQGEQDRFIPRTEEHQFSHEMIDAAKCTLYDVINFNEPEERNGATWP